MRTDTVSFAAKNVALAKRPRYVIEVAFDAASTILRYFTSHSDAALPGGATAILGVVEGLSGTSQTLNPDTANATIGNISFSLVDKASIVTTTLGGQLVLGRSTRRQRVRVYVGYEGLAWADYTLVQTQLVTEIGYGEGRYQFSCADVQREMRKDIFELAKTTLAQSLSATATTIEVFDTSAFTLLAHGTSYSDAPSATVAYVKVQDEVIRYTGKTSTQFTGCTRGALNTRAVEHAVDATASADQRTAVEEYVYLELPALKLMYALLTGILSRQFGESGTAQAGSATSLTLAAGVAIGSVSPVGRTLRLTAGAGSVQERVVSAYDSTTKVATVSTRWHTNIMVRSEEFDNASWAKDGGSTIVANAAAAPDGAVTADEFTKGGGAFGFWAPMNYQASYNASGKTFSGSIWLKSLSGTVSGTIGVSDVSTNIFTQAFTATTEWTRFQIINKSGFVNSGFISFGLHTLTGGAGTKVLCWGAQLEEAVDVGDYIKTEAAAITIPGATTTYALEVTLPTAWHLGIPTPYVRLSDFTDASKRDLWDTADDEQGFVTRFEGLTKTDGKKFIESELNLLCGTFMPVYADGALGLKRMANVLAGASYVRMLDAGNLVSVGDLVHDFGALHNVIQVNWNWETARKDFTRINLLIDSASVTVHGKADPLKLKFRGLHGSRHSAVILAQRFDALRDRYTGPPLRTDVTVLPSLNTLEVGDVVRLRPAGVRDFVFPGGGALDRSFEIQNITTDWITGNLGLKLFASSQAPSAIAATSDATVLSQAWYVGTGTPLSSVLTITGSNPGHVTVGGTLTGTADMNAAGSIFYYDGDLQIDAGVTVNLVNNVQLRVRGFLQNNGTLNGVANGLAGAAAKSPADDFDYNAGTAGFIGTTEAGGGFRGGAIEQIRGGSISGSVSAVPSFTLAWNGTTLAGLPGDLRGSSGSGGMPVSIYSDASNRFLLARGGGGAGGAGGAGLLVVNRGFAQGVSAKVDLSGGDGSASTLLSSAYYPGSGAGGAPGGLVVILDGAGASATGLTEAAFVAEFGTTPILGNHISDNPDPADIPFYSDFHGTGDGTTFSLPSLSGARGGSRVQYVPGNTTATPDQPAATLTAPTNLGLASGTSELLLQGDGTVVPRIKVTWTPSTDARTVGYDIQSKESSEAVTSYRSIAPALGQAAAAAWIANVRDGVNHDVRIRAAGAVREVSDWVEITNYFVVGKTEKPADVTLFTIEGTVLTWSPVADQDVFGYLLKYQPGTSRSWGDAIPLHNGEITSSPYDMLIVPTGPVVLMVKAIDSSGNESQNAAYIVTEFGDPLVANVVETLDRKAAGFPGVKTNCTVSGGNLVADSITPLMWKADDSANMWGVDPSVLMWATVQYAPMTYLDSLSFSQAGEGSLLTIDHTITGDPWSLEYRENSAAPMWDADTGKLMWATDSGTPMWDDPAFLPWPGQIAVKNSLYDFRINAGQANTQGQVTEFTLNVDMPDIEEVLNDIVISSGGTRLPITKSWRVIKAVSLTLQADGGSAMKAQVEDKNAVLGPLVKCYDASNVATSGLVDANPIKGY